MRAYIGWAGLEPRSRASLFQSMPARSLNLSGGPMTGGHARGNQAPLQSHRPPRRQSPGTPFRAGAVTMHADGAALSMMPTARRARRRAPPPQRPKTAHHPTPRNRHGAAPAAPRPSRGVDAHSDSHLRRWSFQQGQRPRPTTPTSGNVEEDYCEKGAAEAFRCERGSDLALTRHK